MDAITQLTSRARGSAEIGSARSHPCVHACMTSDSVPGVRGRTGCEKYETGVWAEDKGEASLRFECRKNC